MELLQRILLVAERNRLVYAGIAKALLLARHTGARLELFLCDVWQSHEATANPVSTHDPGRERYAREYLRCLAQMVISRDVQIELQWSCAESVTRGVLDRLGEEPAQLVVWASSEPFAALAAFAAPLVSQGAAVLATQGQPWRATPEFLNALLITSWRERQPQNLIPATWLPELLARRCGAQLQYMVASPPSLAGSIRLHEPDLITVTQDSPESAGRPEALSRVDMSGMRADVLFVGAARRERIARNAHARSLATN